jgi:hypothetical protein
MFHGLFDDSVSTGGIVLTLNAKDQEKVDLPLLDTL